MPNQHVAERNHSRLIEFASPVGLPLASTQLSEASCSTKYTSTPCRRRPATQLIRSQTPPPLPGLFASAPLTMINGLHCACEFCTHPPLIRDMGTASADAQIS